MFGDLLSKLLQKQVKSTLQDKLGGTGASVLSGLFGGKHENWLGPQHDIFGRFRQTENPLQNLFGEKWQNGQSEESQFNFQDMLKQFIR